MGNSFFFDKKIGYLLVLLLFNQLLYSQDIAINEVMSSNGSVISDEDGDYEDWIELYNYGTTSVNLEGFGLTDDPSVPFKWVFPSVVVQPGEYLLIWASDKNIVEVGQPLHTNFKISSSGESIVLTDPNGVLIDEAPGVFLEENVSIGRQPDGTGSWLYFYTPTPNAANSSVGLPELLTPPVFSHNSGLYPQDFDLVISHNSNDAIIVYTLDGSEPDINNTSGTTFQYKNDYPFEVGDNFGDFLTESYISHIYSEPINIYDRSAEPDRLANKNTRQHPIYVPSTPVRKGTVVKARAYVNGIASKTVSKNYFVWEEGNPYQIPVISLQIQENYLFDYQDGIYTAGVDFDTWRTNNPTNTQGYRPEWCNYWRSGSDWEYPVHIEFFDAGTFNSVMSSNGGFRIHGNNSRAHGIKSLRLYARSEYSESGVFEHSLMTQTIYDSPLPNNQKFKRILLRGDGTGGAVANDVVFNRLMQPVYNGVTRIRPAVHFINGEFWGLTAIRDRYDNHHYALNFNLDSDNIAQIDCEGANCALDEGDDVDYQDFIDLRDFIIQNDMTDADKYSQVENRLDITSFIDHIVLEIFSGNNSYERKYWKAKIPENDSYGDGKWRVTVQDFEASFNADQSTVDFWVSPVVMQSPNETLFGHLIENNDFKIRFINRVADLLNTAFTTERFTAVTNQTFDEIEPYLEEDLNRFPREQFYGATQKQNLLNWGANRPQTLRNNLKNFFDISNTVDLTFNVSDENAGYIGINTISIEPATPGVSQNPYPWTGVYFHNIPITIRAVANPGYVFTHWSGDINSTDEVLTFTPTQDMQIQANFQWEGNPNEVVYFWLMDASIPNDTPLESLTNTYSANGLQANIIYTSCLDGYPFNSEHPYWRKASMECRNAPTPINYRPEANNDIPYSTNIMRGIQIKQPFKTDTSENTMELVFPTTNLENIKLSFAIESDGAAQILLVDYWNGSEWSTDGLTNPTEAIGSSYELKEFDFSDISVADNNPEFRIRLRFDGEDMFIDEGKRVHFNNIAIDGTSTLSTEEFIKNTASVRVYPNPANEFITILSDQKMNKVILYNYLGQVVYQNSPKSSEHQINLQDLPTGIYILRTVYNTTEQAVKVVKK